jgi:NADPH:quinone reductase-like Zn-dependent oxidoreductase
MVVKSNLKLVDIPKPQASKGRLVVRVFATTFNPFDIQTALGKYAPDHAVAGSFLLGGRRRYIDISGSAYDRPLLR